MKLATSLLLLAAGANAFAPASQTMRSTKMSMSEAPAEPEPEPEMAESSPDSVGALNSLALKLNPIVPFWDPLGLTEINFYDMGQDASIGFLRHAEIKHGRVAMAAFVGYCVQSNWHWPWAMMRDGTPFPSTDLSPEAQWDSVPETAKWQIFTVIAALELWDESSGGEAYTDGDADKMVHYTKGRKPGQYPSFQLFRDNVHWVLDLYDPFGLFKKMSEEKKEERLITEINNGRLAMIGIFAFLAADKVQGAVPFLDKYAQPYDGNIMVPFEGQFSFFS